MTTEPRWTIDEDGWLISPSTTHALASWNHAQAVDADCRMRPEDFDALVALVRGASEVDQLRAELTKVRRKAATWQRKYEELAESCAVNVLENVAAEDLEVRLEAAEAVIRRATALLTERSLDGMTHFDHFAMLVELAELFTGEPDAVARARAGAPTGASLRQRNAIESAAIDTAKRLNLAEPVPDTGADQ